MQHLDEGTIHAWLDGALAPDESQRVEAHATACEACSGLVAEARGLIAASSRILTSLDDVRADVIPVRQGERTAAGDDLAAIRARKAVAELNRRRRWWAQRRVLAAAAIVFVAAGTITVWQQGAFRDTTRNVAFERASDVAPPAAPPAPSEARSTAAGKSDAQRGATVGGAAGSRDGRREKEGVADSRPRDLAAGTPAPATQSRDAAAEADRLQQSPERARLELSKLGATQQGQQANVQAPPAAQTLPAPQIRQQSTEAQRLARLVLADSIPRALALPGVGTTGASGRRDEGAAKAALPLIAGCYEITAPVTTPSTGLFPTAILLDTVVAAQRGDSVWYRARALSTQTNDVDLMWRVAPVADPSWTVVEITARRGQAADSIRVALEREPRNQATSVGARRAAESRRELSPRPVVVTARQTSCPRR